MCHAVKTAQSRQPVHSPGMQPADDERECVCARVCVVDLLHYTLLASNQNRSTALDNAIAAVFRLWLNAKQQQKDNKEWR
eukprot:1162008-Pelagomonas_calceolata.AAC.10